MHCIGIDLGTTNSLVSYWDETEGKVKLIPNEFGDTLTPSVVGFPKGAEVLVGKAAKEMLINEPDRAFREFKRDMGTKTEYRVDRKSYLPEELSSFVLRQLKQDAEAYFGEPVDEAVISVPAYFTDKQRCATRVAGQLAGLSVKRIINEPSAAALSYHVDQMADHAVYLISDFGGGTLDISIVEAFDNIVEIRAVAGDNKLGGKDFNDAIVDCFCAENRLNRKKLGKEQIELLYKEAEDLKKCLSVQDSVERSIVLDGQNMVLSLTRAQLKKQADFVFRRMLEPIQKAVTMSGFSLSEIDQVILVGGSSKMPLVQEFMRSIFHERVQVDKNPDEIIALGVGTAVGIKERKAGIKDMLLSDICPFSLGTCVSDGSFAVHIEKNVILPYSRTRMYTTVEDNQRRIAFPIYQGENMIAKANELLDEIRIDIPPRPAGEIQVEVTFSYDINGIFDVDIECRDCDVNIHRSLVVGNMGMSADELKERKDRLENLKIQNDIVMKSNYLVYRANRMYQEAGESEKQILLEEMRKYRAIQQNETDPKLRRESIVKFTMLLDMLEQEKETINADQFWKEDE